MSQWTLPGTRPGSPPPGPNRSVHNFTPSGTVQNASPPSHLPPSRPSTALGSRCRICQAPLSICQEARGGICDRDQCRRQHAIHGILRRKQEETAAVWQSARDLRQRVAQAAGIAEASHIQLAVVNNYRQALRRLPPSRRRAFRAHLRSIIERACNEKLDSLSVEDLHQELTAAVNHAPEPPVVTSVCAMCQGHCCRGGGNKAYVEVPVIRSFLALNPGARPSAVLRAYLDRLPEESYDGSCIYHGGSGCTLPRPMRSALCNRFFCSGLNVVRSELAGDTSVPVLVVTVDGPDLKHSALLQPTESGVQTTNTDALMEGR